MKEGTHRSSIRSVTDGDIAADANATAGGKTKLTLQEFLTGTVTKPTKSSRYSRGAETEALDLSRKRANTADGPVREPMTEERLAALA